MTVTRRLTLVFDLDDTLVDTFGLLIAPLELVALRKTGIKKEETLQEKALLNFILKLRKRYPERIQEKLRRHSRTFADRIIASRNEVFDDFDVSDLKIDPAIVLMLEELATSHSLVLITEGSRKTQSAKIEHLGLTRLFSDILIVDAAAKQTKEAALSKYLREKSIAANDTVIIGNRLDREIQAGNRIGATTVWVKFGEGSEHMTRNVATPDVTIENIIELPKVIAALTAGEHGVNVKRK